MSYEPKVWENGSATGVVPDAGDLNRLEEGLAAVAQQVDSVDTEASSTVGLLALMPATGTGSKALYYATDAGTYADFTNGGAYTKVADLPGTGGVQLARISVGTLVNITSTSVARRRGQIGCVGRLCGIDGRIADHELRASEPVAVLLPRPSHPGNECQ